MRERIVIAEGSVPCLAAHARLQFDQHRNQWIVQAPERLLVLDEIAHAILERCDGVASVAAIIDALAGQYAAPREVIARDVNALLQDLADKGIMTA